MHPSSYLYKYGTLSLVMNKGNWLQTRGIENFVMGSFHPENMYKVYLFAKHIYKFVSVGFT